MELWVSNLFDRCPLGIMQNLLHTNLLSFSLFSYAFFSMAIIIVALIFFFLIKCYPCSNMTSMTGKVVEITKSLVCSGFVFRSERHPTIPRDPRFHIPQHKKIKCCLSSWNDMYDELQHWDLLREEEMKVLLNRNSFCRKHTNAEPFLLSLSLSRVYQAIYFVAILVERVMVMLQAHFVCFFSMNILCSSVLSCYLYSFFQLRS